MGECKVSFDLTRCTGCGSCARCCPMSVIRLDEGRPAVVAGHRCIDCMHCVAACPVRAVKYEPVDSETLYRQTPEDAVERLLLSRRSVRSFRADPPSEAMIQRALDAAAYAPSGKNEHANRWTVLMGLDEVRCTARQAIEWCRGNGEAPELVKLYDKGVDLLTCGAPCIIVGWAPLDALNPCVDTVIALATAELMLVRQGLGTCWGGYLRQISDASPELRARLCVPEGARVQCALMVGWPQREHYPNIPWKPPASIQWLGEIK